MENSILNFVGDESHQEEVTSTLNLRRTQQDDFEMVVDPGGGP